MAVPPLRLELWLQFKPLLFSTSAQGAVIKMFLSLLPASQRGCQTCSILLPKSAVYSFRGLWETAEGEGILYEGKRGVSAEAVKMAGGLSVLQRKTGSFDYL